MSTETLTWTFPTVNTAVPPVPIPATDVLVASIFDSLSPLPLGTVNGAPGSKGTYTTPPLPNGVNVFTVTISDGGVTSAPSNAVSQDVEPPPAPPAAVTDLAGTFNP